jgi:hypothetical protein
MWYKLWYSLEAECIHLFVLVTDPTPHKRARHGGPVFYDVSTNTLFDPNDDSDCSNQCRVCMAEGNELINIFGPEGKLTKCAMKINKFLPIYVSIVFYWLA